MLLSFFKALKVNEWSKMIDINIKGVLHGIAAVLPVMKQQKRGYIFNISSDADRKLFTGSSVYSATKAAVTMISEGLRKELTEEGFIDVRVSSLSIGAVSSELTTHITDGDVLKKVQRRRQFFIDSCSFF